MSKADNNGKAVAAGPPRLCHVIKVDNFDGYGFNLHAEKGKPGQYIGKVDDGSPAEHAGLRQGDRIIEVNAVNIGRETHKEVVQRIKAIANEVQLLVVDASVAVGKDNRLVDPVPLNGTVHKTNGVSNSNDHRGEAVAIADSTTAPIAEEKRIAASNITPDIVVQLPSTPSSPKSESNYHTADSSHSSYDQTDHVAEPKATAHTNGRDEIIPIKVHTDTVTSIDVNATTKTSTFSTSPKDYGTSAHSTFVSTASFTTGEDEPPSVESVLTSASSASPSYSSPPSSPKAEVNHQKTATVVTVTPPPSPKVPIASAPSAPPTTKTPSTPSVVAVPAPQINGSSQPLSSASALPSVIAAPPTNQSPTKQSSNGGGVSTAAGSGLNLNMTAAELRAKLAAKKKYDPKANSLDLLKKYEIVEKL